MIECPQGVQQGQGPEQGRLGGLVHEVKAQEVIKPQRLQLQRHCGQIDSLDFRQSGGGQLVEAGLSVQPVGLARSFTPCGAICRSAAHTVD